MPPLTCTPKMLHPSRRIAAATRAIRINPANRPRLEMLPLGLKGYVPTPAHLALVTTKYWGPGGVHLTVAFLDGEEPALRSRILSHMNAWSKTANVKFVETASANDADVRVAREEGDGGGFWSYLGTDIKDPRLPTQQTMNLEGFTMNTDDSEFYRVVRHETGHTLGFPHEHMRKELVALIDPDKAKQYFWNLSGWDATTVEQQVLTPLEESSLLGTERPDESSIMCYQIPGDITYNGSPILGGTDIDDSDYAFAALLYPPDLVPGLAGSPKSRSAGQISLEDFLAAVSRASLRVQQEAEHAPGSGAGTTKRPRIFLGVVASEQ